MFIGDWAARGALYWPERVAVCDAARDVRLTYRALNTRANALAAWLRDVGGVRAGDRVGVLAHIGPEVLDALFACGKLGATLVPYNWRLSAHELASLSRATRPTALLYGEDFLDGASALAAAGGRGMTLVHLEGAGLPTSRPYAEALGYGDGRPVTRERVDEEDILCLLFTGGTTGVPKAARISYRMVAWNTLNTLVHEVRPGDVTLTHTPLFHTGGLFVYTLPLLTVGGTVVLLRRWDPDEMLRLIQAERVSLLFAVPTQYQQLADCRGFAGADLSSLRFLTSGGAPMPVPLLERWARAHPGVPFKQGFGMTEFGPGIFSMAPEDARAKAGSIGRPNYFVAARLVDDHGAEVPPGVVGELWLRGPGMCSGYHENPEATAEAIDPDGWLHSGDLAWRDADGFYFIAGRKKDLFISGGENVYPLELEAVLHQHPAVALAAVVGVPDPKWGEVGHAFVTLEPGASVTSEELLEHLRARVARYKCPKQLAIVPALPLTPAGKILKRELRERASASAA